MRVTASLLTVLCAIWCQQAQADDPPAPTQPAAPTTAAQTTAAQTTAAAPATSASTSAEPKGSAQAASPELKPGVTVVGAKPDLTPEEKDLINRGYKLEVHNGEKYFCRREQQLESRLPGPKTCDSAQQIQARRLESQEAVRVIQTNTSRNSN